MYKPALSILAVFLLISCSLEYDSSVTEEMDTSIPTSSLNHVKRVQVQQGSPKVVFEAETAVVWEEREETELSDFTFLEYDENQEIITRGQAKYLLISDDHDAEVDGDIYGYSIRNEASITAENLYWNDKERILSSDQDKQVTIEMDNGSLLQGKGFEADMYTNTTRFKSGISGSLESGSDKEK